MTRNRMNEDDPVVADVRRWRAKLQKEAGGTLEGLMRLIREREAEAKRAAGQNGRPSKKAGASTSRRASRRSPSRSSARKTRRRAG